VAVDCLLETAVEHWRRLELCRGDRCDGPADLGCRRAGRKSL